MKNPYCQNCGNICKTVKNGKTTYMHGLSEKNIPAQMG